MHAGAVGCRVDRVDAEIADQQVGGGVVAERDRRNDELRHREALAILSAGHKVRTADEVAAAEDDRVVKDAGAASSSEYAVVTISTLMIEAVGKCTVELYEASGALGQACAHKRRGSPASRRDSMESSFQRCAEGRAATSTAPAAPKNPMRLTSRFPDSGASRRAKKRRRPRTTPSRSPA